MPSKKNWFPQNYISRISWPKSQFFQAWSTDCQRTGATGRSEMVRGRHRRTRTVKVRTALFRFYPAGQTDSGQLFLLNPDRIRTADRIEADRIRTDRHRTQNPDRIQTADRHRINSRQRQDTDSAVRVVWCEARTTSRTSSTTSCCFKIAHIRSGSSSV